MKKAYSLASLQHEARKILHSFVSDLQLLGPRGGGVSKFEAEDLHGWSLDLKAKYMGLSFTPIGCDPFPSLNH
jgi:hypothetical protein